MGVAAERDGVSPDFVYVSRWWSSTAECVLPVINPWRSDGAEGGKGCFGKCEEMVMMQRLNL